MGKVHRSDEHLIWSRLGKVVKCRSVKCKLEPDIWNKELVCGVRAVPWNWEGVQDKTEEPEVVFQDRVIPEEQQVPEPESRGGLPKPSRLYIRNADVRKYGFTTGCPKCEAIMVGDTRNFTHNEVCRKRIEEAMTASELDKDRVQKARERFDDMSVVVVLRA